MPLADPKIICAPERLESLRQLRLKEQPQETFNRLTRIATKMLGAPVSLVSMVESDHQFFVGETGMDIDKDNIGQYSTPLSLSFCQHVVAYREPFVVNDSRTHPLVSDNGAVELLHVIAYAGIPITAQNGEVLGSMCVIDHKPREWTKEQLDLLADLAKAASTEMYLRAETSNHRETIVQLAATVGSLEAENMRIGGLERLKTDMIRLAAHDLCTPLNSIRGCVQMLSEPCDSPDSNQELLHYIHLASVQMEEMIKNILSLERIEAMAADGKMERIDLEQLAMDVLARHTVFTEQRKQEFHLDAMRGPAWVDGDSTQLIEAMDNLIGNAVKYTPDGGHITIQLEPQGDRVRFAVRDTGFGIPTTKQGRLFEPFYRVRTSETQEISGTGLGLNLTKNIVVRHGGTMEFRSVYGEGSTFGFVLPASRQSLKAA